MKNREALERLYLGLDNHNTLAKCYDMLFKDLKQLDKYKKAITLIKDKNVQIYELLNSSSVESYNNLSWSTYDFDGLELDKQEYNLLKEVLENA